ncbi:MAG: hypothetical protein HQM13_10295 [SAR324 cluster bacterium]|nr:hypothetical protein [SAR324 cluster bacterium]
MFGLFKKKATAGYRHTTKRKDWENVMDELYGGVIGKFRNGLAVISNTAKQGTDSQGELIDKLSIRMKSGLDTDLRSMIQDLERENFDKIFKLTQKQSGTDIYSIKNLGLPNKCLVFPVQSDLSSSKKALLVFEGPFVQERLTKTLEGINEILDHAVKSPSKKHDPVLTPSGKIPPTIAKRDIHKTDIQIIKTRLTYLEDSDTLSNEQKEEMKNLKEFIEQKLKDSFR